jgi:hypothetical protein
MTQIRCIAAIIVMLMIVAGCAARTQQDLGRSALIAGELALAIDEQEQAAFKAGLYDVKRHNELGVVILRMLYAVRSYERAAVAAQDPTQARLEALKALDDVSQAAKGVPAIIAAVEAVKVVLGSKEGP